MIRQSKKRVKQDGEYKRVCDEIDREAKANGQWRCFFCGMPLYERADHHHAKGRDGDLLTDKRYIVLAHNDCHVRLWHGTPKSELERYWWYESFNKRLCELLK